MKSFKRAKADLAQLIQSAQALKLELLLEDLLTPAEIIDIHQRLSILRELRHGESQRNIAKKLGVSTSKVNRGSQILKFGTGELKKALEDQKTSSHSFE